MNKRQRKKHFKKFKATLPDVMYKVVMDYVFKAVEVLLLKWMNNEITTDKYLEELNTPAPAQHIVNLLMYSPEDKRDGKGAGEG